MSDARRGWRRHAVRAWTGTLAIAVVAMTGPAALGAPLEDRDTRAGRIAPSAEQQRAAESMATSVRWSAARPVP